jgi:hypothetical protein
MERDMDKLGMAISMPPSFGVSMHFHAEIKADLSVFEVIERLFQPAIPLKRDRFLFPPLE